MHGTKYRVLAVVGWLAYTCAQVYILYAGTAMPTLLVHGLYPEEIVCKAAKDGAESEGVSIYCVEDAPLKVAEAARHCIDYWYYSITGHDGF